MSKGEILGILGILLVGVGEIYALFFMPSELMPFLFFVGIIVFIICFIYLAKLYREGKKLMEEDKANQTKAD